MYSRSEYEFVSIPKSIRVDGSIMPRRKEPSGVSLRGEDLCFLYERAARITKLYLAGGASFDYSPPVLDFDRAVSAEQLSRVLLAAWGARAFGEMYSLPNVDLATHGPFRDLSCTIGTTPSLVSRSSSYDFGVRGVARLSAEEAARVSAGRSMVERGDPIEGAQLERAFAALDDVRHVPVSGVEIRGANGDSFDVASHTAVGGSEPSVESMQPAVTRFRKFGGEESPQEPRWSTLAKYSESLEVFATFYWSRARRASADAETDSSSGILVYAVRLSDISREACIAALDAAAKMAVGEAGLSFTQPSADEGSFDIWGLLNQAVSFYAVPPSFSPD